MKNLPPIYKLLEDADHRGELISCLLEVESHSLRQEYSPLLCKLHNSGKISLVSNDNIAAIETLTHKDFWSVVYLLEQTIPELECSHSDVLRLVYTLTKAESDGAAGMLNTSLVKWCKANPKKAKQIVEGAKSLDRMCLLHCTYAIQGLESVELALDLLEHSSKAVVAVGLRSLGGLELECEAIAKYIIDKCFETIAIEKNPDVRYSAIETTFKIWDGLGPSEPYRQKQFLDVIINTNEGDELVQLSAALFYHSKGLMPDSINQILVALKGDIPNPQATLHWLNLALYSKRVCWDLDKVIDVLAAQIPKLEAPIELNDFYYFCQWIWENPNNTAHLFSSWLTSGQFRLCEFLAAMIDKKGENDTIVDFSKANLPNDTGDQIFMARKCVGFLWSHEVTAASILLNIVKNGKKSGREVAEELLYNPLLLSYSGALRSFLEEQVKNPSKRISDCTKRLIKKHDTYLLGLKQTEYLVEFYPTIEQRRAAAMKDRERNKDIQNQAHEKSILSKLVSTHQTLLYGKKSFSLIHLEGGKKVPSVTPLSEFSYSTEYPRLLVVDPVGFNNMLTTFRAERKVS